MNLADVMMHQVNPRKRRIMDELENVNARNEPVIDVVGYDNIANERDVNDKALIYQQVMAYDEILIREDVVEELINVEDTTGEELYTEDYIAEVKNFDTRTVAARNAEEMALAGLTPVHINNEALTPRANYANFYNTEAIVYTGAWNSNAMYTEEAMYADPRYGVTRNNENLCVTRNNDNLCVEFANTETMTAIDMTLGALNSNITPKYKHGETLNAEALHYNYRNTEATPYQALYARPWNSEAMRTETMYAVDMTAEALNAQARDAQVIDSNEPYIDVVGNAEELNDETIDPEGIMTNDSATDGAEADDEASISADVVQVAFTEDHSKANHKRHFNTTWQESQCNINECLDEEAEDLQQLDQSNQYWEQADDELFEFEDTDSVNDQALELQEQQPQTPIWRERATTGFQISSTSTPIRKNSAKQKLLLIRL